jgi:DNA-binding NarL/FixJ family response regulator
MDSSSDRGAFEYLLKDVTRDNLVEAVRRAARGVAVPTEPHRQDPVARLTEREREVLILMAGGMANRAIAAELGIGEETIKSHVKRVLRKLKARDRTSAVLRSWHLGLLPPDAMVAEVVPEPASECGAESDLRCGSPPAAPGPVPVAPRAQ